MPDILSDLIWVQTLCKDYQQMTLVDKELALCIMVTPKYSISSGSTLFAKTKVILGSAVAQW